MMRLKIAFLYILGCLVGLILLASSRARSTDSLADTLLDQDSYSINAELLIKSLHQQLSALYPNDNYSGYIDFSFFDVNNYDYRELSERQKSLSCLDTMKYFF